MISIKILALVAGALMLVACSATESEELVGRSLVELQLKSQADVPYHGIINPAEKSLQARPTEVAQAEEGDVASDPTQTAFASRQSFFEQPPRPRERKTYIINGLASNIGSIGYGFTNLSKKITGSKLYNYASFVESSTVIRSRITRELKAAHKANPDVEINLIGISFGANIVTIIAQELDRNDIPVNYLATLDGPAMMPVRENVHVNDNFTCTNIDCFKTTSRLAWGNKKTKHEAFRIKSSHIPLANHDKVHRRIMTQIYAVPNPMTEQQSAQQFVLQ